MRYSEIAARVGAPCVADFTTDPAEVPAFERLMQDRPEVRLLCRIDRPGAEVMHVACTSETMSRRLLDTWG